MKTIALAFTAAVLVAACAHEHANNGPMITTGATQQSTAPVSAESAEKLAHARCEREVTCSNVGAGRSYSTREVCVEKLRADNLNDLTNANCPNGISVTQLDKCLADIRGERCDHPLDTISRLNSCRTGALCPK